jgi:hypothetical protein
MSSWDWSKSRSSVVTRLRVTANDLLERIRAKFLGVGRLCHQDFFPAFQIA